MFCTVCGNPLSGVGRFCSRCGAPAPSSEESAPAMRLSTPSSSGLRTLTRFAFAWDALARHTHFRLEDPSGRSVGEVVAEGVFPLRCTFFDENQQPALSVDSVRARGLVYDFRILDPGGSVLASLEPKASFLSRKYAVTVSGTETLELTSDATGNEYRLSETPAGKALATGQRKLGLRAERAEIEISETLTFDRRIALGAMFLATYFTTRRRGA